MTEAGDNEPRTTEIQHWSRLGREIVRAIMAAVTGTFLLMALADDPWDGDELFKGPAVGLGAYGGDRGLRRMLGPDEGATEEED